MGTEYQLFLMEWASVLWALLILGIVCFIIGFMRFFLGMGYYRKLIREQEAREKTMLLELKEHVKKLKAEKT